MDYRWMNETVYESMIDGWKNETDDDRGTTDRWVDELDDTLDNEGWW